jgi:hypothetical protein
LVERHGCTKHECHVCDVAGFPVVQWLIEGKGTVECGRHIRDFTGIPVVQWLIEAGAKEEHRLCTCDV